MSARDRQQKDARKKRAELEGMRQVLNSPDGRALMSWIILETIGAEGKGSKQLRAFGRDMLKAAQVANWEGLQEMRQEWERPSAAPEPEEDEE